MNAPKSHPPRRHYEAPRLRRIRLAADEVMAKGCKQATPSAGYQNAGCVTGGCFEAGS
ncbi:MAG: hypothetical protein ACI9DC_000143 [Gammaproteobacteria bacterium]|jgi:hypothetical protein